jgi:hypothetical protein
MAIGSPAWLGHSYAHLVSSIGLHMNLSNRLQFFVQQLADKHDVDLSLQSAVLRLELPGHGRLNVERISECFVAISHYHEVNGTLIPDPEIVVFTGYSNGWVPVSMEDQWGFHEMAEVNRREDGISSFDSEGQESLAAFSDEWADDLERAGWGRAGVCEASSGRYGRMLEALIGILEVSGICLR